MEYIYILCVCVCGGGIYVYIPTHVTHAHTHIYIKCVCGYIYFYILSAVKFACTREETSFFLEVTWMFNICRLLASAGCAP